MLATFISAHRPRASRWTAALTLTMAAIGLAPAAQAQTAGDAILEGREALRTRNAAGLAAARDAAMAAHHPLAMWTDYWELSNRLAEAQQPELDAFYARWRDTYVEDRLRNDWLLELGKRRDWNNFATDFPKFRMNDDRQVTCYWLLVQHLQGEPVRDAARAAWLAQRDADDGCGLMAATLYQAGLFTAGDVWHKARHALDVNRPRAVRQAVALIGPDAERAAQELFDSPARYLARKASAQGRTNAELASLALSRMAVNDPAQAAAALGTKWERTLPSDLAAWSWAMVAKQAAMNLDPKAADYYQHAALRSADDIDWPDNTLAWKVRAALRANEGKGRWQQVVQAVNAMTPEEQRDPAWVYWKARALHSLAEDSQKGEALQQRAQEMLASIAGDFHFYGALAAETLGRPLALPPRPRPLTAEERADVAAHAGLRRALQLIGMGLRNEGVREWNYSLRGMNDRHLLAAAQMACDRQVWDRCINTSDRTRSEIDMAQRFPMPFRDELVARTREIGLDPAYVYGLIRQESRFITDARSHAGASGLMQVMPATARWTARKIGLDYRPSMISDPEVNLKLGTGYLKLVLERFEGSQPMAAAAYNAGPGRPSRWRQGPWLEPAAWAENIPFNETRDYVKKVLWNASYYAALINGEPPALTPRLGPPVGPRVTPEPAGEGELP